MHTRPFRPFVVALFACAAVAHADGLEGKWVLKGRHPTLGPLESHMDVAVSGDAVSVTERVELAGQSLPRRWSGTVSDGRAALRPMEGMSGAVGGGEASGLTLRLDGAELVGEVTEPAGVTLLRGERESGGVRDLFSGDLKGKLLVLAEKELKKAAWKGQKLEQDFGLSRYFHIGVGVKVRAVPPEQLTPDQRQAQAQLAGPSSWIDTEVHGGARLPFGTTLDLGHGVALGLGFEPGARVRYEVLDLHPIPGGLDQLGVAVDTLKETAARAVDLPLRAEEAQALGLGAQRVLEGEAWVALSGNLVFGREVKTYGEDVVRIGASVSLGGAWRLGGLIRYEVTRLPGQEVRLRVTRGTSRTRSASADLLLGAALGESWAHDQLEPRMEYLSSDTLREKAADAVVGAAASAVRDVLQVRLVGAATQRDDDELELIWRLDLERPAAREAWERAMRGDLTVLDALARDPASGVVQELRVVALEERTWLSSELKISVLFKAGWNRTTEVSDLDVLDAGGRTRYEVFRFSRSRHWKLLGAHERRRALSMEVVRAAPEAGQVRRALRYVLDVEDPVTTGGDAERVRRTLVAWGLPEAALPETDRPWFRSRYGPTRTQLVVELGEEGVAAVLSAGRDRWLQGYIESFTQLEGEEPTWATEWGRAQLEFPSSSDRDDQRERWELRRARDFVDGIDALANGTSPEARADALRDLASSARWDVYAVTTLVRMAPRQAVRVSGTLAGKRIQVDSAFSGERFEARALFGLPPREVIRGRALEASARRGEAGDAR